MLGAGNRNGMLCNEVLLMFMRQTCCVRKIHDNGSYLCCRKTFCEIILYVCFWETFPLLCFAQKLTRITFFFFFLMVIEELEPHSLETIFLENSAVLLIFCFV